MGEDSNTWHIIFGGRLMSFYLEHGSAHCLLKAQTELVFECEFNALNRFYVLDSAVAAISNNLN